MQRGMEIKHLRGGVLAVKKSTGGRASSLEHQRGTRNVYIKQLDKYHPPK